MKINYEWKKPEQWGGYNTKDKLFYLTTLDKSKLIKENEDGWEKSYNEYLNQKNDWQLFGLTEKE